MLKVPPPAEGKASKMKLALDKVFAINCVGADAKFAPFARLSNRMLLWKGARKSSIPSLLAQGLRVLGGDAELKIGAHGNPVIFLHPKDAGGVLVELEQRRARPDLASLWRLERRAGSENELRRRTRADDVLLALDKVAQASWIGGGERRRRRLHLHRRRWIRFSKVHCGILEKLDH